MATPIAGMTSEMEKIHSLWALTKPQTFPAEDGSSRKVTAWHRMGRKNAKTLDEIMNVLGYDKLIAKEKSKLREKFKRDISSYEFYAKQVEREFRKQAKTHLKKYIQAMDREYMKVNNVHFVMVAIPLEDPTKYAYWPQALEDAESQLTVYGNVEEHALAVWAQTKGVKPMARKYDAGVAKAKALLKHPQIDKKTEHLLRQIARGDDADAAPLLNA